VQIVVFCEKKYFSYLTKRRDPYEKKSQFFLKKYHYLNINFLFLAIFRNKNSGWLTTQRLENFLFLEKKILPARILASRKKETIEII
jgi:hypothetical protein